ncbi:serine hydrolase [Bradyrhizobium sp. Arg237L]|uniref:serine hydrolase domain-containing protein n=1 Tax=Bradyrhizobium sp. Arg237L TaxID=3003352 RepID=UPI00249E1F12|nr:serine hydrolase domain-containing protein [Bradyrhizobium sp. Arg237L]MDI4232918.1 serine hydrolase [Bradyrhizobium sp. Arg237L]
MMLHGFLSATIVAVCITFPAVAEPLPKASQPEELGISAQRLKILDAAFQSEVDSGKLPGAVVLIVRNGKVAYSRAFGYQDREKQIAMKPDAIFRIASMTKPLVSVAAMMLVEEGKLQLVSPVSAFLPEFKEVKVGVEKANDGTGKPELVLEPPRREMTIHDLLRHTSGLTYGQFGDSLVKQAYRSANIGAPGESLAAVVSKLAQLPLAYQPGTTFEYSMSTDVLGRVVEVASGMELDQFIAERITKPLGMPDTGFYVSEGHAGRVAEPQVDAATGKRPPMRDVSVRPSWLSGGGGMVSTAADYARFCQMLLNGGAFEGRRFLSPRTVAYMTTDHLPPGTVISQAVQGFGSLIPSPALGQGFGLGFAVRTDVGRNPMPGSVGEFYWTGSSGTTFWIDPKENLVAILMVQVPLLRGAYYRSLIRNMVYQAFAN